MLVYLAKNGSLATIILQIALTANLVVDIIMSSKNMATKATCIMVYVGSKLG